MSSDETTSAQDAAAARLKGRRIIVTGGASGIGRATAKLFAHLGARVAILDRDAAAAGQVAQDISGFAVAMDLVDPQQVSDAVAQAARDMHGVDGIVNAAGITAAASIANTSLDVWQRTMAINLTGPFLVVQAALPHLRAAKGSTVVNISSGAALLPRPDRTAYSASKGGLLALTRAMAVELSPSIRVNAVCPGSVETPMLSVSDASDEASADRVSRYAMKRLGTADEIANAILFLTSHESSYITGITLAADGGRTFH